jgi:hypothetical protein
MAGVQTFAEAAHLLELAPATAQPLKENDTSRTMKMFTSLWGRLGMQP